TQEDAFNAAGRLLELVKDFPFQEEYHRAAWLAAALTPLVRFCIDKAPLFLTDSNVPGAGKGLLLNCISRIVAGTDFTVMMYTDDDDEMRKRILALALSGTRMVLLDNLVGKFGNATLDAAMTATSWSDRVLGINKVATAPLQLTWFATGNNVQLGSEIY